MSGCTLNTCMCEECEAATRRSAWCGDQSTLWSACGAASELVSSAISLSGELRFQMESMPAESTAAKTAGWKLDQETSMT